MPPTLALSLPSLETHPANPPEIRPAKVSEWLAEAGKRDAAMAARLIGDALAATNRVAMSDARRMELAELYWATAANLWSQLERQFARASHPLAGDALEAAKGALTLSSELATAYKHLLSREADKRISLGGARMQTALVHRCLQATARVLTSSYIAYAPVPPRTWHDAHAIYVFARLRNLHLTTLPGDPPEATPERLYTQSLLLALANPYGFLQGQISTVLRYLQEHGHWAKLTDVAPVHRMAKAVAMPRLTMAVDMTARARMPGARKSMGSFVVVGRTCTSEKKTRSRTGMPSVRSTASPRRSVIVTSARVWAAYALTSVPRRETVPFTLT